MVQAFLAQTDETPEKACFAIAGPVRQQTSQLTNLSWYLDATRLQRELNLEAVSLINDFAAVSYGVLGIKDEEIEPLQAVQPQNDAPIAIIGAGTGLGEGFLIPQGNGDYQIFGTEGGHADFAPRSELEFQILDYIRQQKQISRVSVERIVSGQGIISIYQALRDLDVHPESKTSVAEIIRKWEKQQSTDQDPAAAIAQAAETDRLCQKTMELFIEAYAAEAGNLALKLLPYGGLYIAGGIAAKNLAWMKSNRFLKIFRDKGRVSSILDAVPINVILNPEVGLIGSIRYGLKSE
jgi:glucokinase